jgi:hypothetical protein
MIRAEHHSFLREQGKGACNIRGRQARTIGTNQDKLVKAEAGDFLSGGLEAFGEACAALLVHTESGESGSRFSRGKQVHVRANLGGSEPAE